MDAVLFHPETSHAQGADFVAGHVRYGRIIRRRAGDADRQAARPLQVTIPIADIHGAAEWTLRQWKQHEKLEKLDAKLRKLKDRGDRRWYVNSQGQTLAVIEGPVDFRMGSPPTEKGRFDDEIPHRRIIHRRFALAAKEVTVEDYWEFVKDNSVDYHILNDRNSPDPDWSYEQSLVV